MKNMLFGTLLGPTIRHGATIAAGWLIAEGYADQATAEQVAGGLLAAGGIGLSLLEKRFR